jgi:hypothetical protein
MAKTVTEVRIFGARVAILVLAAAATAGEARGLRVWESLRYLEYTDGTPFFYLGDTAWELFHRLNREEADRYLADRAAKGFTVIQAVVLAELDGLDTPNAYGHKPLINNDPTMPNEDYFQHVDYVVNKARELGLFIGMLPTWGKYWKTVPESSIRRTHGSTAAFWACGTRSPIVWILGGDHNPGDNGERSILGAIADGLRRATAAAT